MFLRVNTVRRESKTYRYAQLVESYRRDIDKLPAHRVLANLGELSDLEIRNFRLALSASKSGETLVIPKTVKRKVDSTVKVHQNLAYLDLAVLSEIWDELGIGQLIRGVTPASQSDLNIETVLRTLVLYQCSNPGSKLSATRWLPHTSLIETLGISPNQFNNSRLHRSLTNFEEHLPALMSRLPEIYQKHFGSFDSLFLDVSDAYFHGQGPSLAQNSKTKEGHFKKKIGIVLLCNEDGLPLRWEVIPGASSDNKPMQEMIDSVQGLSWLGKAPIVCDRAMGKTAQIKSMCDNGMPFLTALTRTEYHSYVKNLPTISSPTNYQNDPDKMTAHAIAQVKGAGMRKVSKTLYIKDCGLITKENTDGLHASFNTDHHELAQAMKLAQKIKELKQSGSYASLAAAGASLNFNRSRVGRYCTLNYLTPSIQEQVAQGKANNRTLSELVAIARIEDHESMEQAFSDLLKLPAKKRSLGLRKIRTEGDPESFTVRTIACFNPELFLQKRKTAQATLEKVQLFIRNLNDSLNTPRRGRKLEPITAKIDQFLRRDNLISAFNIEIKTINTQFAQYQIEATLDEKEWTKRRSYDGFSILIANQDNNAAAADLAQLYREKNTVEIDFHIIKSFVKVRPVRHRTDHKVKAHVGLCMLALLLERTLRKKLEGKYSAQQALDTLRYCHLNRMLAGENSYYSLTEPSPEMIDILKLLKMTHLTEEQHLQTRIKTRSL